MGAPPVRSRIARRACGFVVYVLGKTAKGPPSALRWAVFRSNKKRREQNRDLECCPARRGSKPGRPSPENWRATTQGIAALLPAERTGDHPKNGGAAPGNTGGEREEPTRETAEFVQRVQSQLLVGVARAHARGATPGNNARTVSRGFVGNRHPRYRKRRRDCHTSEFKASSSLESHVRTHGGRHRGATRGPQAEDL